MLPIFPGVPGSHRLQWEGCSQEGGLELKNVDQSNQCKAAQSAFSGPAVLKVLLPSTVMPGLSEMAVARVAIPALMTGFGLKYFVSFLREFFVCVSVCLYSYTTVQWGLNGLTRDNGLLVDGKKNTT